jgi:hypothetical protein
MTFYKHLPNKVCWYWGKISNKNIFEQKNSNKKIEQKIFQQKNFETSSCIFLNIYIWLSLSNPSGCPKFKLLRTQCELKKINSDKATRFSGDESFKKSFFAFVFLKAKAGFIGCKNENYFNSDKEDEIRWMITQKGGSIKLDFQVLNRVARW